MLLRTLLVCRQPAVLGGPLPGWLPTHPYRWNSSRKADLPIDGVQRWMTFLRDFDFSSLRFAVHEPRMNR